MTVHPSRHQQCLLVALSLLLLWPVAGLIAGWQWALFMPLWLLALGLSWRALAVPPFELEWDGQWLLWQGERYQLGRGSRTLPGVLRLLLCPDSSGAEPAAPRQLWLFSDALPPEHYRLLARAINFPAGGR